MAITEWHAEMQVLTRGTSLKIYKACDQPAVGKFVALYGRPGTGKTTLLEQLAKCKHTTPVFYIDIKGGAWVFSDTADITIAPVQTYLEFSTLSNNLFMAKRLPFKSIVLDHGTELQALNIMGIIGPSGGKISGSGMATQQQWGFSTAQMLNVIRMYKNMCETLGVHVFMAVQEDARKDSVTSQVVKSGIGFTPSLAARFPSMVDIVGHLTVQNDPPHYTRVLNFATTPHSDAKFRRKRTEAAYKIPLTIAYRDEDVLLDILNTLIGGEDWPTAKYAKLQSKAKVEYATLAQEAPSIVEAAVAERMAPDDTLSQQGEST